MSLIQRENDKLCLPKNNEDINELLNTMKSSCLEFGNKIDEKERKISEKTEEMNAHKLRTYKEIDNYIAHLIQLLEIRKNQLKEDYSEIEQVERRKLKKKVLKLKSNSKELKELMDELNCFIDEFDAEIEFPANRSMYKSLLNQLRLFKAHYDEPISDFKKCKYELPAFYTLPNWDYEKIEEFGKVIRNRRLEKPIVIFNNTNIGVYEYVLDTDNYRKLKLETEEVQCMRMPKYFQTVWIPADRYLIAGGYEVKSPNHHDPNPPRADSNSLSVSSASAPSLSKRNQNTHKKNYNIHNVITSDKAFIFESLHFYKCENMIYPRMYFSFLYAHNFVYAIGGFENLNNIPAIISSGERFSIEHKVWEEMEPMSQERYNAGICSIGDKYILVFGGRSEDSFLSSVERYNTELNIWTRLNCILPEPMSNMHVLTLSSNQVLILGGLKKRVLQRALSRGLGGSKMKEEEGFHSLPDPIQKQYELDSQLHFLNIETGRVQTGKGFTFRKKLSFVSLNDRGHVYCMFVNKNSELPELDILDLNEICPSYSPYSDLLRVKSRVAKIGRISFDEFFEKDLFGNSNEKPQDAPIIELSEIKQ